MSFSENITTRYTTKNKDIYDQVMDLSKSNDLAKSRAQLLLVERGLEHTNNPRPLIAKEKVVYKDRPPVEKVVYRNRPEEHIVEHLSDTKLGQANKKGQRASDDKLTNPNKAKSGLASSKVALEEKKSSKGERIAGWIGGGILASVIVGGLVYKWLNIPK